MIENTILSFFTYILYTPDDITNREDYKSSLSELREIQKNDEIEKETNEVKIDDKEDGPAVWIDQSSRASKLIDVDEQKVEYCVQL